jgi:general secretion pathway protein J
MAASSARPAREEGFTLIELLVALGVLALAAGMLVAVLNSAWLAVRAQGGPAGDTSVGAAQRILRARLERLAPVIRSDSSKAIVDADGDAQLFSFAAAPLDRLAPDALQRFRLVLSPAGDLMLYTASGLDDRIDLRDRSLVGWRPTRLLSDVGTMDIAYFGPDPFSRRDRWQSFWLDRPQPPALVRIRLTFAAGDPRSWPDLIVRPRASVNTACRIERGTGRCEAD